MIMAVGVGPVAGGITGGLQGLTLANTTTAYAVNVATNGVAGSTQHVITEKHHGRDPDVYEALHINDFGIYCGDNIDQVTCDVYTQGSKMDGAAKVDFEGDIRYGNSISGFSCWLVSQGCITKGELYSTTFMYKESFMGDSVARNRYVTNVDTNVTNPLFTANWSVADITGTLLPKRLFHFEKVKEAMLQFIFNLV